jgi:hypothetical protein
MGTEKGSIQRRQPRSVIRKGLGEFLPTRYSHIMSSGMTDVIGSSRLCSRAATLAALQNGQKTIWGSCENVILIRNAGTNPKVMAVRSKVNVTERT